MPNMRLYRLMFLTDKQSRIDYATPRQICTCDEGVDSSSFSVSASFEQPPAHSSAFEPVPHRFCSASFISDGLTNARDSATNCCICSSTATFTTHVDAAHHPNVPTGNRQAHAGSAAGRLDAPQPRPQPLAFVPNRGKFAQDEQFQVAAMGGEVAFRTTGLAFSMPDPIVRPRPTPRPEPNVRADLQEWLDAHGPPAAPLHVNLAFLGATPAPRLAPTDPAPAAGVVNYLRGSAPERWTTNVPTFAGVQYTQLYPGIDLAYTGADGTLKST
jgi:hypothetical protein